jgi:signal transduction histidine kinase/DNA-binding response OmpR family regulator
MVTGDGTASILVVDDKPEAILAIEVALQGLGQEMVTAGSGREALRRVLAQPFAVILLDVNMPDMDGFETAELIRQHRHAKQTPIIFLTASGDDIHIRRGYSLGAVDFIVTPVNREVLRTKVSVFVDLYRTTERARQQAQSLSARATQLHRLTRASLHIGSAQTIEGIARAVTEAARDVIGAHQALVSLSLVGVTRARSAGRPAASVVDRPLVTASFSDRYAHLRDRRIEPPPSLTSFARERNTPFRMGERELSHHADWTLSPGGPRLKGCLVAPLVEIDGRNMGFVQLSDKEDGEFTDDDEAVLVQLAQLGSVAVQNAVHIAAREAQRVEEELIATLSHELRTPLQAILGWTRVLRAAPAESPSLARGLEVIERNVNAQSRLIEELLDVSRIASGKLTVEARPITFGPIVRAAVEALRPEAEQKGLAVTAIIAGDGPRISGDPDRLQQVVGNLLNNAVKFTPRGGRITVEVAPRHGGVELSVSDTGVGLREGQEAFVFERFWQAEHGSKRSHGGLGIGLTVVRHIVEQHGGSVRVESAGPGLGATFAVYLPAVAEAPKEIEAPPHTARSAAGMPDLAGVNVLLVEDEPDSREMLREALERHRARVTAVGSVGEAIDALRSSRPHVLVSDIAMPGADGYDLIRHLRSQKAEEGGDIPALALTAFARAEDRARALAAGYQMHASKPVEPLTILTAVAELAAAPRIVVTNGAS